MSKLAMFLMGLTMGPLAAAAASIETPAPKVFASYKNLYESGNDEHVLLILHLPKEAGTAFVEIHNRTRQEISLFQFILSALGHEGELDFDDLPAGWSAVKELKLASLRELSISRPKAFNVNADEITPSLVIHQVTASGQKLRLGKRKI